MEQLSINLSLTALAVCLVDAAWLTFALSTRRYQVAASSLIATLLGGLLVLTAGASWFTNENFPWPRTEQLMVAAATGGWLVLRRRLANRQISMLDPAHWPWRVMTHVLLIAASVWLFHALTSSNSSDSLPEYVQKGVMAPDAVLVTDQGRVFSVFHFDLQGRTYEDAPPFTHITTLEPAQSHTAPRPVRIAATDPRSNCHGWVFTGGRYGVSEAVVEALLQDNGYQQVDAPLAGDVVVYRDASGAVLHSGRVRRVHENGEVWIESKWGPGGRYLHLPQDQCYSGNPQYYRSPRPDRYAQIVSTPPKQAETGLLASLGATPRRPLRRARV